MLKILLFLAMALVCHHTAFAVERPNFILCMTDDQGWGDVGYNGHPVLQTPELDAMASAGLRLDRAYAAHPVCSPTRASFLTGRHPNRMACFSWGHTLRPEETTIAEALKTAGYATGHFGKWHVGSCDPRDEVSPGQSGFDTWVSSPNFYENDPFFSHNGKVAQASGESSQVTVEAALEFIKSQSGRDQPFVAVIWFGNPHTPHEATAELKALYPNQSPAEQNYYGEITGVDRAMGHLRKQLREMNLADNTLLWFTSDNGPQKRSPGSSGGLRGAKSDLWEGGVRVPGILEWPGRITPGRVSNVPVVTSDIFPTIMELAGVTPTDRQPVLDGVSVAGLIDEKMTNRSAPIGFWIWPEKGIPVRSSELLLELRDNPPATPPERTPASRTEQIFSIDDRPGNAAWLDGDWKLYLIRQDGKKDRWELYNLAKDRAEKTNLADKHPERVEKMRTALLDWQNSVIQSLNGEDYPTSPE